MPPRRPQMASVTAYQGNPVMLFYAATKGAIVAFTRSLSGQRVNRGIRVNAVAPAYVFLTSDLASYITGQTLPVNGGRIVNG